MLPDWLETPSPPKPSLSPERQAALDELARREGLMTHLTDFAREFVEVEPAQHHRIICDAVDSMINDEFDVLVISSPPASAKSTYISVAAPAYIIGRDPKARIISVSRAAELAADFGGRVKNIVEDELFGNITGVFVAQDTRAKDNWKTTDGGGYFAVGASGGVLGKRADWVICLTKNNYLCTKNGYTSISDIKIGDEVEAYDTEKLSTGYYRVIDTGWRDTDDIYRVYTTNGRMVETTGNHPFFVNGKFVQAMALTVGDVLLSSVRYPGDTLGTGAGQAGETGQDGVLLRSQLLDHTRERGERIQDPQDVQQLWDRIYEQGARCARSAGLLGEVQTGDVSEKRIIVTHRDAEELRHLRKGISSDNQHNEVPVLLDVVQEHFPQSADDVVRKSGIPGWGDPKQAVTRQRSEVQSDEEAGDVHGQSGVRDLSVDGELTRSPCGHGLNQQRVDQYRDIVQEVSCGTTWCRPGETFETTVARVERVCENERVWDIKVEHCRNFFANGILVHNCDDIHSSFDDAQSVTQTAKIHSWFESDLLSRLTPTGKLIVIGQRLSPNDIIGFVKKRSLKNPKIRMKELKFTAICEDSVGDPLHRAVGERMWPEFYTENYLLDKQQDAYIWKTLWMQEPPSDTGAWVSQDEIKMVDIVPSQLTRYLLSDLALSVNKGDYSVHIVVGVDPAHNVYIEDAWRDRCSIEVTAAKHLQLAQTYNPSESLIDDDNAAKVYVQLLARLARENGIAVPWHTMPMRGQDKETRAAPLRGWFKRGKVYMRRAEWSTWLTKELLEFPNALGSGVDDGVDALSLIGRRLASLSAPTPDIKPVVHTKYAHEATLNDLWEDRGRNLNNRGRI